MNGKETYVLSGQDEMILRPSIPCNLTVQWEPKVAEISSELVDLHARLALLEKQVAAYRAYFSETDLL